MAAKRTQKKIRDAKDRASQAVRKNRWKEALAAYAELEALEPGEGQWPGRAADVHRRTGERELEVAALERAADHFTDGGFLLKAIATCKRVLELDPDHTRIQERLTDLYADRGLSDPGITQEANPEGSGLDRGRPLEEIVLTEVVPTEDASDLRPTEESGTFSEVPLDFDYQGSLAGDESELPPELVLPREPAEPAPEARSTARQTLPQVPLFSGLPASALRQLLDGVDLVALSEGERLFEEGDLGDALYVVAEGAVVPIARTEDGASKRLAVLEEGSFFGETALLANQPRNAGIEALVDSRLLAVDRGIVTDLLDRDREFLSRMLGFFRDRLVARLIQTSRFFSPLENAARRELARAFRFLEVEAGSELIRQGAPAPALHVLLAGEVEVVQARADGSNRALAQLDVGHAFGEMSILQGDAAMASCIATKKCWLLALPRKHILGLLAQHAPLHEAALALAEERRAENLRRESGGGASPFDFDLGLV